MSQEVAIALDIGTSSVKIGIVSVEGEVIFHNRMFFSYPLLASSLFATFLKGLNEAINESIDKKYTVLGICVSGNGPSLVAVDKNSREKDFLLMWNERAVYEKFDSSPSIYLPRLLMLKKAYSEVYQNASIFLPLVEYLLFRLTEKKIATLTEMRFLPYYWEEDDLKTIGFNAHLLPSFVELGEEIGFYRGIKLFAGPPDYVAALIGTATLFEHSACDVAGSSEGINITVKEKPLNLPQSFRLMPSPIPNLWTIAALFADFGTRFSNSVKEVKNTYLFRSEEREDNFVQTMEIVFASHFSHTPLEPCFEPVYNIVLDILSSLKEAFEGLEKVTNFNGSYSVSGGHAKSELYLKMKAIATKRKFNLLNHADTELLGDAIIVFYKSGLYPSLQEGAKQTVKTVKTFTP